jgi:hypothetical protein
MTKTFKNIRNSVFEVEKPSTQKKPFRPTISLPLERPADFIDRRQGPEAVIPHDLAESGWKPAESPPMSPVYSTTSSSSYRRSRTSSPASSRASSATPRTSYESGDYYFGDAAGKKVSFRLEAKVIPLRTRGSTASLASSLYADEGVLPPPIEDDEHIQARIGRNRFAAAEYIREIEGTPMILVDGKLYL